MVFSLRLVQHGAICNLSYWSRVTFIWVTRMLGWSSLHKSYQLWCVCLLKLQAEEKQEIRNLHVGSMVYKDGMRAWTSQQCFKFRCCCDCRLVKHMCSNTCYKALEFLMMRLSMNLRCLGNAEPSYSIWNFFLPLNIEMSVIILILLTILNFWMITLLTSINGLDRKIFLVLEWCQ